MVSGIGGGRESRRTIGGTAWSRRLKLSAITALLAGVAVLSAQHAWAQTPCQDFDPRCQTDGVCQADGTCKGTPKANGTACDDGNACTTNDQCQAGRCVAGGAVATGTPCTSPLGPCITNARCQSFGGVSFCLGDLVECPQGADKCQINACDPRTGQCTLTVTNQCDDPCQTGQCDPSSGDCVNMQPKADGTVCDDGNECTSNDRCQSGECNGSLTNGTITPASTATPTPSGAVTASNTPVEAACEGDCNHNGLVAIDEIRTGIDIVLGNAAASECPLFTANAGAPILISDLITAVNDASEGCTAIEFSPTPKATQPTATIAPPSATSTPSATGAAQTSTPTATATNAGASPSPIASPGTTPGGGSSLAQRAAGTVQSTTSAFLAIPDLLSALLGHLPGSSSVLVPRSLISLPFTCSSGGGQASCDQTVILFPPSVGPPTYTITLTNCQPNSALTFNGTITATDQDTNVCFTAVPTGATLSTQNLTVQSTGAGGSITATFTNLTGTVDLSCSTGSCQCTADTVNLALTGTMSVISKDAQGATLSSSQVTFGTGSTIAISVDQWASQCTPVIYTMEIDGDMTLATDGKTFQGTFDGYTLHDDATSGQDMIDVSGAITSTCFGTAVDFTSDNPLAVSTGACPHSGAVEVSANGTTDLVTYTASGGVQVDLHNDGSVDQSFGTCHDSALLACPGT